MTINRETLSLIVDIFEDFLDEKGVTIENPEKEEPENNAQIYGSDYDQLMGRLQTLFANSGIHIPDVYDNEVNAPDPVEELVIYIPAYDDIIYIEQGSGDNLLKEDIEEGYVDYLNYYVFDAEDVNSDVVEAADAGMLLRDEVVTEAYSSLKETVNDVLDMVYGKTELTWVELSGGKEWK